MYFCGIIKPHALHYADEIKDALGDSGIRIITTKHLYFDTVIIEVLYDHMSAHARASIVRELSRDGGIGTALLLESISIERLLEVVGTESDPGKCSAGSIRARFGVHEKPILLHAEFWWKNAFHRPTNMREAVRDMSYIWNHPVRSVNQQS
jgi:nucleoside diphosphate kinase